MVCSCFQQFLQFLWMVITRRVTLSEISFILDLLMLNLQSKRLDIFQLFSSENRRQLLLSFRILFSPLNCNRIITLDNKKAKFRTQYEYRSSVLHLLGKALSILFDIKRLSLLQGANSFSFLLGNQLFAKILVFSYLYCDQCHVKFYRRNQSFLKAFVFHDKTFQFVICVLSTMTLHFFQMRTASWSLSLTAEAESTCGGCRDPESARPRPKSSSEIRYIDDRLG